MWLSVKFPEVVGDGGEECEGLWDQICIESFLEEDEQ